MTRRPFQVDLRGVVDLLGRHIYSSPQVYLRELLQNGLDAVTARRTLDPDAAAGELRITAATPEDPVFTFTDNGIGLTADEAAEFLATVGRTSKRDDILDLRRGDFLGQFGIGILACFMVADSITVRSRSARGGDPIEWEGSADGTFSVRTLDPAEARDMPIGTTVAIRPRPDDLALATESRVRALATQYGQYLPVRLLLRSGTGNTWDDLSTSAWFLDAMDTAAVREAGRDLVGAEPFDAIPLAVPGTGTTGLAFVLPFPAPIGVRATHRVYLGRMLLTEHSADLVPDWAFFVRCVINTDGLTPTASREHLVDDTALEVTREELGRSIRRWILDLATRAPHRFAQFLAVHELAIKAMASHDDEFAATVIPHLTVETSAGMMSVADLARRTPRIRYATTVDEFRQMAALATEPLVNGGYAFETDVLRRIPELIEGTDVERVRVTDLLNDLEAPALADRAGADELAQRAEQALADEGCAVIARVFRPTDVAGIYVVDPEVIRRIGRRKAVRAAPPLWAQVLDDIDRRTDSSSDAAIERAQLCVNWSNALVQQLAKLGDDLVFDRTIKLIYVQALLASHRPLGASERALLNSSLSDLIQLNLVQPPQ